MAAPGGRSLSLAAPAPALTAVWQGPCRTSLRSRPRPYPEVWLCHHLTLGSHACNKGPRVPTLGGPRKLKMKAILSFAPAFLSLSCFLRNQ